jgi:predicted transcriptional regulator
MKNRDRILSFVQNNPGQTQQKMAMELGIPPYTGQQVNKILRELIEEGSVKVERSEKPYKYYPNYRVLDTSVKPFV